MHTEVKNEHKSDDAQNNLCTFKIIKNKEVFQKDQYTDFTYNDITSVTKIFASKCDQNPRGRPYSLCSEWKRNFIFCLPSKSKGNRCDHLICTRTEFIHLRLAANFEKLGQLAPPFVILNRWYTIESIGERKLIQGSFLIGGNDFISILLQLDHFCHQHRNHNTYTNLYDNRS